VFATPAWARASVQFVAEWHALLAGRGLDQLSPPEVEHVLLELPAERAAYAGLLGDLNGWPDRSPLSRRVPSDQEVQELHRAKGRWRAICLLDDDPALRTAAVLFRRVFVLDPLYDSGDLLYAAWHDPFIKAEHARRLAEQASLLVRARPLLRDGTAILAPDHLPGSWDPRPGWRRPREDAEQHLQQAWALRTALVLLNWADRLDALVVVTRDDIAGQLPVALGRHAIDCGVMLPDAPQLEEAVQQRASSPNLERGWATARKIARGRSRRRLRDVACALEQIDGTRRAVANLWQLVLGEPRLADPALLLRRVLNRDDPFRHPELPPTGLRRRPLCLLIRGQGSVVRDQWSVIHCLAE
jgi:hypothetical protein